MSSWQHDAVHVDQQSGHHSLVRVTGSHHVFKSPGSGQTLVVPHPKKDLGKGLVRAKGAGWKPD